MEGYGRQARLTTGSFDAKLVAETAQLSVHESISSIRVVYSSSASSDSILFYRKLYINSTLLRPESPATIPVCRRGRYRVRGPQMRLGAFLSTPTVQAARSVSESASRRVEGRSSAVGEHKSVASCRLAVYIVYHIPYCHLPDEHVHPGSRLWGLPFPCSMHIHDNIPVPLFPRCDRHLRYGVY